MLILDWILLLSQLLPLLGIGGAFIWGCKKLFRRRVALYLQLIVCALGCLALSRLFGLVSFFTAGGLPRGFHVGYLGTFGCFLFLFSSNYGQMDGLLDDGSQAFAQYRRRSLLAPLVMILGLPALFLSPAPLTIQITTAAVLLPAMASAYYNLKHILLPDMGLGFVRACRPCNHYALLLAGLSEAELLLDAWRAHIPALAAAVLIALTAIFLVRSAERGRILWTT